MIGSAESSTPLKNLKSRKEPFSKPKTPLEVTSRRLQLLMDKALEELIDAKHRHKKIKSPQTKQEVEEAQAHLKFCQEQIEKNEIAKIAQEIEIRKLYNTVHQGRIAEKTAHVELVRGQEKHHAELMILEHTKEVHNKELSNRPFAGRAYRFPTDVNADPFDWGPTALDQLGEMFNECIDKPLCIHDLPKKRINTLISEFARQKNDVFSLIWTLNAENSETLQESYESLAEEILVYRIKSETDEQFRNRIHNKLEHRNTVNWLLIYENVSDIFFALPNIEETRKVLICFASSAPYREGGYKVPNDLEIFVLTEQVKSLIEIVQISKMPVVLYGTPGIGKSVAVSAVANEMKKEYPLIWTLDAQSPESLTKSYQEIATQIGVIYDNDECESLFPFIQKKPWLLIYENVEFPIPLPDMGENGKIVITSCCNSGVLPYENYMTMQPFSRQEAVDFLEQATEKKDSIEMRQLIELCGCYPASLEKAVKDILKYKSDINWYLGPFKNALSEPDICPCKSSVPFSNQNIRNMVAISPWPTNLQQSLKQRFNSLHPDVQQWVQMCLFLRFDYIPSSFFYAWFEQNQRNKKIKLSAETIKQEILKSGLVQYNERNKAFSIKPVIQQALLLSLIVKYVETNRVPYRWVLDASSLLSNAWNFIIGIEHLIEDKKTWAQHFVYLADTPLHNLRTKKIHPATKTLFSKNILKAGAELTKERKIHSALSLYSFLFWYCDIFDDAINEELNSAMAEVYLNEKEYRLASRHYGWTISHAKTRLPKKTKPFKIPFSDPRRKNFAYTELAEGGYLPLKEEDIPIDIVPLLELGEKAKTYNEKIIGIKKELNERLTKLGKLEDATVSDIENLRQIARCMNLNNFGDWKRSFQYLKKAWELFNENVGLKGVSSSVMYGKLFYDLGYYHYQHTDFAKACCYLMLALENFTAYEKDKWVQKCQDFIEQCQHNMRRIF